MIPEGWRLAKLSDVATVRRGAGSQYLKYVEKPEDGIRLIRIGDFLGNDPVYVEHNKHMDRFKLTKDDILIAGTGATAGIVFEVPDEFAGLAFSYNAPLIQVGQNASKHFIFDVLSSQIVVRQQQSLFTGNAQPFLDTKSILGFKIPLPPIPEQRRIAEILSTWDRAIEMVSALIAKAVAQKQALMQSLLTGKHRLPGFSGEWRWIKFSEVFERVRQKNDVGNTNVLTISAQHGLISQVEYFNKSIASKDVRGYTLLRHGDFAYNKSYSDGYPMGAFKPLERYESGIVSSLYICFRLSSDEHDHGFFRHYFEADLFNREISAIAQEGARNHGLLNVSVVDFFDTSLHAPSHEEQVAIAKVINDAERTELALRTQFTALRKEKSALMQQLLTGKRRVKVDQREDA